MPDIKRHWVTAIMQDHFGEKPMSGNAIGELKEAMINPELIDSGDLCIEIIRKCAAVADEKARESRAGGDDTCNCSQAILGVLEDE